MSEPISEFPGWLEVIRSLGLPILGALAAFISYLQYRLAKKKRSDDLFDRRYAFFSEFKTYWLETGDGLHGPKRPADIHELVPLAETGGLLFGDDVQNMILSLEGKVHDGSPWFVNSDVSEPFLKYMRFAS